MNKNLPAMVAVALLAGPMAANAIVIYDLQGTVPFGGVSIQYSSDDFITSNLFVAGSDPNLTCNLAGGRTCVDVFFKPDPPIGAEDTISINYMFAGSTFNLFTRFEDVFSTPGTFTSLSHGGVTLTITSVPTSVPEPGTLALFGLGLVGLGFARRRRATN